MIQSPYCFDLFYPKIFLWRNIMRRIHGFLLLVVAGSLNSQDYTEKTFLMPQPLRVPSQHTFYDYTYDLLARGDDIRTGHFQATYIYRHSDNRRKIGKYFGRNGWNEIKIGSGQTDFQASNLVFTDDPDSISLAGTIEILPSQKIKGVHLSYIKRLIQISKKLFINVAMPVVRVTNYLNARVLNEKQQTIEGTQFGPFCYFTGHLQQKTGNFKQEPLCAARMSCGKKRSKSGVADIDCCLGYQFGLEDTYYLCPRLSMVIPTGNRPCGCYLFEPVLGHGKQWGIGFGVEAMTVLHKNEETKLDLTCSYEIKHFFSNTQKRTVGFRSDDWSSVKAWSQYELLGEQGKYGVFPAANVLTRDVRVHQGLLFDCYVNLNFQHRGCFLSVGYNYFSRAEEDVRVRCWPEDRYALVNPNHYTSNTRFTIVSDPTPADDNLEGPIQRAMLDGSVAATPPITTHKVYGLISYLCKSRPLFVGIGGAYEACQDNAALEGYELYFKLGYSF